MLQFLFSVKGLLLNTHKNLHWWSSRARAEHTPGGTTKGNELSISGKQELMGASSPMDTQAGRHSLMLLVNHSGS